MSKKKELSKEEKINAEIKRLSAIYKDIPKNNKSIVDGLIKTAGFMRIQLEEYQQDLILNGYVGDFQQSDKVPPYEKERPVAKLYINLQKNYQTTIKQLSDLLPKASSVKTNIDDGFDDFLGDRDD